MSEHDSPHAEPGHDPHPSRGGARQEDHGDIFRAYLIVFGTLSVLTLVSYLAYVLVHSASATASMMIILLVSVVKATCVAVIFMHLKWDWGKVFGIMIPVVIMAIMMIIVLLPDMAFAPRRDMSPAALGNVERDGPGEAP
jgi:caa(3)-type oxidase subunit IV